MRAQQNIQKRKARMLAELRLVGGNVTTASHNAGISRSTHYDYLANDRDYAKAVDDIQQEMIDRAEYVVHELLMSENTKASVRIRAASIILNAKGKDRGYGTAHRKIEHSGQVQSQVKVIVDRTANGPGFEHWI